MKGRMPPKRRKARQAAVGATACGQISQPPTHSGHAAVVPQRHADRQLTSLVTRTAAPTPLPAGSQGVVWGTVGSPAAREAPPTPANPHSRSRRAPPRPHVTVAEWGGLAAGASMAAGSAGCQRFRFRRSERGRARSRSELGARAGRRR